MMGTMSDEYEAYGHAEASSADRTVARFHAIDEKVNAMREQRLSDPDSLGDKLFKLVMPALTGLVAGQLFQMAWDKGTSRTRRHGDATQQSFLMGLLFAACSAAFGAVVSQLSTRGSQAFVDRRHRKAARRR